MKTLLPFNHPTYLRRMARELSHRSAGFYYNGERFTRASVDGYNSVTGGRAPSLVIERTLEWNARGNPIKTETHHFIDLSNVVFGDGNGGTICASRQKR